MLKTLKILSKLKNKYLNNLNTSTLKDKIKHYSQQN